MGLEKGDLNLALEKKEKKKKKRKKKKEKFVWQPCWLWFILYSNKMGFNSGKGSVCFNGVGEKKGKKKKTEYRNMFLPKL